MPPSAPLGSSSSPVRVAIVGAGPAGFFTAEALLKSTAACFDVDVLERLPTPFGLVRAGVAPDHQQIKSVHKVFEKTAAHERFRFLGNVHVSRDLLVGELAQHYDQVVYAIGSAGDRRLGVPGEELAGSHAATAFVGWYNAHPDFADFPFDLQHELAKTDIASPALKALWRSQVREVVLLARRGPAQAAFDLRELRAIAALEGVQVVLNRAQLEEVIAQRSPELDEATRRTIDGMLALAAPPDGKAERTLRLEFLASPVELLSNAAGRVRAVRVERTALTRDPDGEYRAVGTGSTFELQAGLVFRSVGYRGVPLDGVPFDAGAGVIANRDGRVLDQGQVRAGQYAVGWCRRGATGVIGTNKADANALVERMVADVPTLAPVAPERRTRAAIDHLLASRDVRVTTFADWGVLDEVEISTGRQRGKVREKFVSIEQMMNHLLRTERSPGGDGVVKGP
jgi:ferredoxin--NADP+ reductase